MRTIFEDIFANIFDALGDHNAGQAAATIESTLSNFRNRKPADLRWNHNLAIPGVKVLDNRASCVILFGLKPLGVRFFRADRFRPPGELIRLHPQLYRPSGLLRYDAVALEGE